MRRSVSFGVFFAVVVLVSSALTAPPRNLAVVAPQKPENAEVKIDNFSFGPSTLTVTVGTTVTWTNRDDIPHTVTSSDDPKVVQIQSSRHRRKVLLHLHEGRQLYLLLLDPPEDDRQGDRAMIVRVVTVGAEAQL